MLFLSPCRRQLSFCFSCLTLWLVVCVLSSPLMHSHDLLISLDGWVSVRGWQRKRWVKRERWRRQERKRIHFRPPGVCVCVCILHREVCVESGWVRQSVGLLLSALHSAALLSAEWKHHVSVGRPEEQPCFSELRPAQAVGDGLRMREETKWTQPNTWSRRYRGKRGS